MEEPVKKKNRSNKIMPIVLGVVLMAGGGIGGSAWLHSLRYAETDDAQIDGDISPVSARVGGAVRTIRFTDNQQVHAGDTLLTLDDLDYRIRLEQAEAALDAANADVMLSHENVASSRANVPAAESNIDAAKTRLWKATEDLRRFETLLRNGAVSQDKFDAVKAEKEEAEARLASLQGERGATQKLVSVAERRVAGAVAKIRQAQADVDYAKLQLSYTVVTAPAPGIVSKRAVQVGQLVSAGSPLFCIVNTGDLYVTADFKETQVGRLKPGQEVVITTDVFPGSPLKGSVASFSGATGAKFSLLPPDNATGNFVKVVQRIPVRIAITDFSGLQDLVRPGMSVKAAVRIK
jgi:membrane fusion protein (multidrug efflux system)